MFDRFSLSRLVVLLSLVVPGCANAETVNARYAITLIGLPFGSATVTSTLESAGFRIDLSAKVTGLASLVSPAKGAAAATGTIMDGRVRPATYATSSANSDLTRTTRMTMSNGNVDEAEITPPWGPYPDRVPITPADQRGIIDPMSSLIISVPGKDDVIGPAACNRTIPIFDGATRFDIDLTFTGIRKVKTKGYEGPVAVCAVRYRPIAGHRANRAGTRFHGGEQADRGLARASRPDPDRRPLSHFPDDDDRNRGGRGDAVRGDQFRPSAERNAVSCGQAALPADANRAASQLLGTGLVLAATIAWSFSGSFTRMLSTDVLTAIAWRSFFGGAFLLIPHLAFHGRGSLAAFALSWPGIALTAAQVLCQASTVGAFYGTTIANVAVIYATAPFMAAGLALWLTGERLAPRTLFASLVALCGVIIIVSNGFGSGHLTGDLIAVLMTATFALIIVIPRAYPGSDRELMPATILSAAITFAVFAPLGHPLRTPATDWCTLAGFGFTNFTVAMYLFLAGSRRIAAAQAALIGTLEIVLSPDLGVVFIRRAASRCDRDRRRNDPGGRDLAHGARPAQPLFRQARAVGADRLLGLGR